MWVSRSQDFMMLGRAQAEMATMRQHQLTTGGDLNLMVHYPFCGPASPIPQSLYPTALTRGGACTGGSRHQQDQRQPHYPSCGFWRPVPWQGQPARWLQAHS